MIFQLEQHTYLLDIFVFSIFTIATIIFWLASRGRDDLKGWRIAYVIYNVGFLCKVLGLMENDIASVFASLRAVFYLLSSVVIFLSILREFRLLKKEEDYVRVENNPIRNITPLIFAAPLSFGDIMSRVLVLGILFVAIFMLAVIWRKKRTPTLTFLLLSFVVLVIGIFISSIPTDDIILPLLNKGVDAASSTLLLATGIVITYENRLIKSETKVKKAEEIAEDLEKNTLISNQLKSLAEEMSASAEELSSSSENISSSQTQISRGVSNQVLAIQEIQKEFSLLIKSINEVNASMVDLDNLTSMIRNISDQTNMLALNAAIEAARAGEAGKGFNVVAEQVRKLAAESKKSVEESNTKISNVVAFSKLQEDKSLKILEKIDSIAAVSEETSASTEETAAAAEEQAATMEEISNSAQKILYLSEQILNENFKTSDFITEFKKKD